MDKIIQLKDASGNNVYPLAIASGGAKMDLLWTNPNSTASFDAQTLALDLSGYSLLVFVLRDFTGRIYYNADIAIKSSYPQWINAQFSDYHYERQVTITDSGITFSTGYRNMASFGGTVCVPVEIYGMKM